MKLIFRYMKRYKAAIFMAIFIKLIATMSELTLPYILEYMIDHVVPSKNLIIRNADNILVMEHGDVVEQGNHESLMERKGVYYKLYASQFE